ncbi:MAG TPA: ATP-binding protein [Pyrinomonadaceae bacterium]|nr:ATP-binding protein [Pyrinomonadaceae bacterium]
MARSDAKRHGSLDVRTKLLVMLAVLSLPLLIVSLLQLNNYRKNITEQATTIARVKSVAAEGALDAWLEARPHLVNDPEALDPAQAADLYARLQQHASPDSDAAILVLDSAGRVVPNPNDAATAGAPQSLAREGVAGQHWPDGAMRLTSGRRNQRTGWTAAVGVPLPEYTPAGRSVLIVAATWAVALLASILLSVWAVGRFTKPLRKLATSASTFGEGQLRERVAVETDDEVGTLAAGFNAMAARLEGKFNELRAQGLFISEVLDSLPLGVVVLDSKLVVRRANAAFAEFVGRDAKELAGRGLYEAAAGVAALSEVVEDVRRTRRAFVNYGLPLELVARGGEGGQKFWDVILWPTTETDGVGGDLILIFSEVSKRVRAEKLATAAFASEKARAAELESIINQMDEGVLLVDERGRYRLNPAAARILNRKPGESREPLEVLSAEMKLRDAQGRELALSESPLGRALERGEHVSGEHVQITRPDGEEGILEVSATPLAGEGSRGVVAVFRDITNEVRQYRELMDAYSRLREHDRLKSAFVANVSHELRTPLNVIIGLCQLLERDRHAPLAPLQSEAVTRMERNAHALLELVNHLLDYSRLEAGRAALMLEETDVGEIVNESVAAFEAAARDKRLRLRAEVAPGLESVVTDRHRLSQVLTNLLSNAVKFTATGEITVSAAPLDGGRWSLEVKDTGIGISPEAIGFIFDEFRQVDDRLARSYSGVGLGLAITRKIVELLGGEITVESGLDRGSRFHITWPLAAQQRTGTGSLVRDPEDRAARPDPQPDPAGRVTDLRTYARR